MMASLGETGEMKSPGYPLGYPDGISCNFHFPLIEVGKFIHIYFEDFQLEQIQHYGKWKSIMNKVEEHFKEQIDFIQKFHIHSCGGLSLPTNYLR